LLVVVGGNITLGIKQNALLINTLSNVDAIFVSRYLHSIVEGRPSIGSSPFRRAVAIIVVVAIVVVTIVVIVVVVARHAVAIIVDFVAR
jgi:hypothetical protein